MCVGVGAEAAECFKLCDKHNDLHGGRSCVVALLTLVTLCRALSSACSGLLQSPSAGVFGRAGIVDAPDHAADEDGGVGTADADEDEDDRSQGSGSAADDDEQQGARCCHAAQQARAGTKHSSGSSGRGQLAVAKLSKFEADRLHHRKEQHKALVAQPKVGLGAESSS